MSESQKKFYVLRAISGKENKVREFIENEMRTTQLGEYVAQVLIPTERSFVTRNGKKVIKEKPFLPGYVLVEAVMSENVLQRLREVPNVIGFVGQNGQSAKKTDPQPLRPQEVERILGTMDRLEEQAATDDSDPRFILGETVKVTFGPFSGFDGVIEEVNREKKKLKVMVKIFGRKTPLELGYLQVEKE
ncbi:MAG: transcription termination/antitermination protein NusG [Tannerellaceae bacterium]|jgi:transcriptional antiterminator NusG|nr:transcription termination/antitermination protein NusG [Tannerellaceae bacterium]